MPPRRPRRHGRTASQDIDRVHRAIRALPLIPSVRTDHRPPYVPDYQCLHVFAPTTDPRTEVCARDLTSGTHEIDITAAIGTDAALVAEAAFPDGTVFWHVECETSSDLVVDRHGRCTGWAWGWSGGGYEGGYVEGRLLFSEAGLRARVPDGGKVTLWADPGNGVLLLRGRRVPQ